MKPDIPDALEPFEWQVILIPEDEEGPAFAFTVGLFGRFDHPEILVMGLGLETMHAILNALGRDIKSGRVFRDGEVASDVLRGNACAFRFIERANYPEFLGAAKSFYEHADFSVLQCFWPDKCGLFLWQRGFDPALRFNQQPLFQDLTGQ